jgi:hypothetical protein
MAGHEDSDDRPPPRPSIPKRRREGIVIEATLSTPRAAPSRRVVVALVGAALALAGFYWARTQLAAPSLEAAAADLRRRLDAGEPLGDELAALARLGADPAALASLRPFAATGAPSHASLARAGLAKLRKVGESHPAEADVVARAGAALQRGDIEAALSALRDSPPARAASEDWIEAAQARLAADGAADALASQAAAGAARR